MTLEKRDWPYILGKLGKIREKSINIASNGKVVTAQLTALSTAKALVRHNLNMISKIDLDKLERTKSLFQHIKF